MNKHQLLSTLLICGLLMGTSVDTALAYEIAPGAPVTSSLRDDADTSEETIPEEITYVETIHITTVQDLLDLAESCRLDVWSLDRLVVLEADIDLTGTHFAGIPTFGGTWEGNGHTISGLTLTKDGNIQGLFRYLQATALIQDLHVTGEVHPENDGSTLGGLAGTNAGQILNCSFTGTVAGTQRIGGLVGRNTLTGLIEDCQVDGTLWGTHYTGGVAGENLGVIRNCTNYAQINTSSQQNTVDIADITLESLTGSEAAYTATDMGGMAGTSSGVIRGCINYGDIGYPSMSYNAGGIAGSQTGYLVDCENHGKIQARKDVGGIVGQLEPSHVVQYDIDTLNILSDQINTLSKLTNRASAHADSASRDLNAQLEILNEETQRTQEALEIVLDGTDSREDLMDPDTQLAVRNTLSDSLGDMSGTMEGLTSSLGSNMDTLSKDLKALTKQFDRISSTMEHAEDNLGVTVNDISDLDTLEDTISKIFSCDNYGMIYADQNGGGIVGTMALENDMDLEEDISFYGDQSLNISYETRAVTRECTNHAVIQVKKSNAGGIVGGMDMGAVLDCVNLGQLDAFAAACVGGIAGSSSGSIRGCDAKCAISAKSQAGGIAGKGSTVTGCRSLVEIHCDGPEVGAVLGSSGTPMSLQAALSESVRTVSDNYYLPADSDLGAVDGISYSGCAEPLSLDDFLAIEELPSYFTIMTIRFVCEGHEDITFQIPLGESFSQDLIPQVPDLAIHDGAWDGLSQADLSQILFDKTFTAVYEAYAQTLQTEDCRSNGLPIVIAVGDFPTDSQFAMKSTAKAVTLPEDATLLESWQISSLAESELSIHYQPDIPYQDDMERIQIYVQDALGTWTKRETTVDGRYLIFSMAQDEDTFCVIQLPVDYTNYYLAAAGAGVLLTLILIVIIGKKVKSSRKKKAENAPSTTGSSPVETEDIVIHP